MFLWEGKQEKFRLADFSKMRTSIARGPGPPTLPLHPQMRLSSEEEEGCKRGGALTVATPRL